MYYHDEQENMSRLITGGIDGFVRIHHLYTLATLHGATISSPISTMTCSISKKLYHVHALLQELSKRNGLMIALSNREKGTIVPIVSYLTKHIDNPAFTNVFLNVGCIILDVYSEKYAGKKNKVQQLDNDDDDFEKSMTKLKHVIDCEMRAQKQLKEELSTYDCVFNFVGSMNLV